MSQTSLSKQIICEMFRRAAAADPTTVDLFHPDVEFVVAATSSPQSQEIAPWIGRPFRGRQGIAEFITTAFSIDNYEMLELSVHECIAEDDRAVAFGYWRYRARATGKIAESAFAARVNIKDGMIFRYFFYEDTLAVALSFRHSGAWDIENQGLRRKWPLAHI